MNKLAIFSLVNTLLNKHLSLGLVLVATVLGTFSTKTFAYDFHYGSNESEVLNTDINDSSGWILEGTQIISGTIQATSEWGKASYSISPLNLDNGEITLYWSGIFPKIAKTERDKYYVGLQYADNEPVLYNGQLVDENAELKMALRPKDAANKNNSYHQLYIDPNFDPVNNYSPATTKLELPLISAIDFRLKISKVNLSNYQAYAYFWNSTKTNWELMTGKSGFSSPLEITSSSWLNAQGEIENPITFEAINLQFRNPGSAITAIALTQQIPVVSSFRSFQLSKLATVPESSPMLGLFFLFGLGICCKSKAFSKRHILVTKS